MKINGIEKLYHGTCSPHDNIDLTFSDDFKDFGRGYYLTSNSVQAESWAKRRGKREGICWVYEYTLNDTDINDFKILQLLEYNEEWLNFITRNRRYGHCSGEYDIIYDRMTDNQAEELQKTITLFAQKMISSEYAISKIRFKVDKRRDQYCFKTEKAVALLRRNSFTKYVYRDGQWESFIGGDQH